MSKTPFDKDIETPDEPMELAEEEEEQVPQDAEFRVREPKTPKEEEGDISFKIAGGVFDVERKERPKGKMRRPRMGK